MFNHSRVPLAWRNLTHDRVRFLLFGLGVGFAVLLMFLQTGFRNALLDSNVLLVEKLRPELVLVSPARNALAVRAGFSRRRLSQAAAVPGVASVQPLFIECQLGVLRDVAADPTRRAPSKTVRVVGIDLDGHPLDLPELDPSPGAPHSLVDRLRLPGRALYDRKGRTGHADPLSGRVDRAVSVYGPLRPGAVTELAGQDVRLVGSFALGADFVSDGTLIVSIDTFADWLRRPFVRGGPLDEVDLGLVTLEAGADPRAVQRAIRMSLRDGDVNVLSRAELAERERRFWLRNTPIGFAFGLGTVMGFVVGLAICYQILSSDVADHLAEYATLRAVGYPNSYLAGVVMREAVILAIVGFVPGLLAGWGTYEYLAAVTGLPLRLTPGRITAIALLTVAMCTLPGLLALRKVQEADPADVF